MSAPISSDWMTVLHWLIALRAGSLVQCDVCAAQ